MTYSSLSWNELVRVCAESKDQAAWEDLVCRSKTQISKVIWRVARRYGENSFAVIEELVQDTYAKLCTDNHRILKEFQPRHENAFIGFLLVTATNVARDHFRGRVILKRSSGQNDLELSEIEASVPS